MLVICRFYLDKCLGFTLRRAHVGQTQSSGSSVKLISGAAAQYLDAWLDASKITEGALWRRIQKGRVTTPLSSTAVFDVVSKRAIQAGLAGINPSSLRLGFVTAAAERHLPTFAQRIIERHGGRIAADAEVGKGAKFPFTLPG